MGRDLENSTMNRLHELEAVINYSFKDRDRLLLALTHSSYANEKKNEGLISNERLEFLGDSVLNIVTSEYIYKNFTSLPEGEMSRTRAAIVCEGSLMKCAKKIELGSYLFLGKGEENTGGRNRTSILSDAFEALIGAIFLDGGLEEAGKFILTILNEQITEINCGSIFFDYKTQFQEIIQRTNEQNICYNIIDEKGPDHNKVFVAQLSVNDKVFGVGQGKSKKEAEQKAARIALDKLS